MRKLLTLCLAAVLTLTFATLRAHAATDVTGTWTGTISAPDGNGGFDLTFRTAPPSPAPSSQRRASP